MYARSKSLVFIGCSKDKNFITFKNTLFPHTWQEPIEPNNVNYKEKKLENIKIRIEILKIIKQYVNETERFKGDYGE